MPKRLLPLLSFPVAAAEDSLSATLARIGGGGTQMVPIIERNSDNGEGDRVLGIVTPQSLSLAMHLLGRSRRILERAARTDQRDQ